ncbi:MAG: DUF2306 domain-containing protein [Phycicoccus sp.]|nr:DUF2306 domain-containing protein [Phycicoccus sp.]
MATAHPQRRRRLTQLVATVLCLGVGAYGMVLVGSGFSLIPDPVCGNTFPLALRMHVAASSLALLLLPLQGVPGLRRRGSPWHRWVGRGYGAAAIAGGASGTAAAFTTTSGPVAAAGFTVLGVAWVATTLAAFGHARLGRRAAHQAWGAAVGGTRLRCCHPAHRAAAGQRSRHRLGRGLPRHRLAVLDPQPPRGAAAHRPVPEPQRDQRQRPTAPQQRGHLRAAMTWPAWSGMP